MITKLELIKYLQNCGKLFNTKLLPETKFHILFVQQLKILSLEDKLKGVWGHIPNEGSFSKHYSYLYGKILKSMGKHNGSPDLFFSLPTKSLFLELKSPGKQLCDSQKTFKSWCDLHKVRCEKIETIEEGLNILREEEFLNE